MAPWLMKALMSVSKLRGLSIWLMYSLLQAKWEFPPSVGQQEYTVSAKKQFWRCDMWICQNLTAFWPAFVYNLPTVLLSEIMKKQFFFRTTEENMHLLMNERSSLMLMSAFTCEQKSVSFEMVMQRNRSCIDLLTTRSECCVYQVVIFAEEHQTTSAI